ncbi:MAG: hypothetical protein IJC07_02965 [Clostridia bacterium]|nr:hypothetical protein [Clostridia bacterium]
MYCKYCGKFIETEADVCPECLAQREQASAPAEVKAEPTPVQAVEEPAPATVEVKAEQPAPAPVQAVPTPTPVPQQNSATVGLGKAITGAALGFAGFIFAIVGMELSILPPAGLILNLLFALPMSIIGLVFGVQSIKTFKQVCKEGGRKPIATLICGIAGVVFSGNALLFVLIGLIVSCTVCSGIGYYNSGYYY